MKKTKTGIGAIIATILLVLITLLSIVAFQSWFNNYSSLIFVKTENEKTLNSEVSIEALVNNQLFIKNNLESILTIKNIKIENEDCNLSINISTGIHNISLEECLSNLNLPGGVKDIILITDQNIYTKKYLVQADEVLDTEYFPCLLDGVNVNHGNSFNFYNSTEVPFGQICTFILRTCNNGILEGNNSFNYSSCYSASQDTTPDYFGFTNITNAELNSIIVSNIVIPSGFDGSLNVSIEGDGSPQLSINEGEWITNSQINLSDNLTIRLTSANSDLTSNLVTLTLGSFSTIWSVTTKNSLDCSGLNGGEWISVPGNTDFGTSDFCVMKFEAKNDGSGNAVSQPANKPWVYITQPSARTECSDLGEGYHLITNAEWMSIARNIEVNAVNWNSGIVGTGSLFSGHSDVAPYATLAVSDVNDYYDGTGDSSPSIQKRVLILDNLQVIWDFAGNTYEWANDTCVPNSPWYAGASWLEWNNANLETGVDEERDLAGPIGDYTSANGVGMYYGCTTSGNAFIRGGSYFGPSLTGIYSTYLGVKPTNTNDITGFRCVYSQ